MNNHPIGLPLEKFDVNEIEKGNVHQVLTAAFDGRLKYILGKGITLEESQLAQDDVFTGFPVSGDDDLVNDGWLQAKAVQ